MKLIKRSEIEIIGDWRVVEGKVVSDENEIRVRWLIKRHLKKIAGGGWETLYLDSKDGRYWELTYLQSEMHGGGPQSLVFLPKEDAEKKYKIDKKL